MKLHPALSALLLPASWIFDVVVRCRVWLYRKGIFTPKSLNGVVISVGNLTVGGTGKTPFVLWLAEKLHAEGKRIGILARGYKGDVRADSVPIPQSARGQFLRDSPINDEVYLLGVRLGPRARIGVGADRYSHGRALGKLGIEWFILDDGFQHLQLARDLDILLLDSTDPFGNGRLLPAGRLREPKSAIVRADVLVITRTSHAPALEAVIRRYSQAPLFYAQAKLEGIEPSERSRISAGPGEWLGKKVFLFCGLGNPSAFFADARNWGMEVVGQLAFPDHHHFTQFDVDEIEGRARIVGAEALLCTEKDVFNLREVAFQNLPLFVSRMSLEIIDADSFWQTAHEVLRRKLEASP
jgi:tetraacyldisaccharide 4'-kinase